MPSIKGFSAVPLLEHHEESSAIIFAKERTESAVRQNEKKCLGSVTKS